MKIKGICAISASIAVIVTLAIFGMIWIGEATYSRPSQPLLTWNAGNVNSTTFLANVEGTGGATIFNDLCPFQFNTDRNTGGLYGYRLFSTPAGCANARIHFGFVAPDTSPRTLEIYYTSDSTKGINSVFLNNVNVTSWDGRIGTSPLVLTITPKAGFNLLNVSNTGTSGLSYAMELQAVSVY